MVIGEKVDELAACKGLAGGRRSAAANASVPQGRTSRTVRQQLNVVPERKARNRTWTYVQMHPQRRLRLWLPGPQRGPHKYDRPSYICIVAVLLEICTPQYRCRPVTYVCIERSLPPHNTTIFSSKAKSQIGLHQPLPNPETLVI